MSKKHNEDEKWKKQSHEGGEQGRECTKEDSSGDVKPQETEDSETVSEEQASSTQDSGESSEGEASSGKEDSGKEENAELLQLKDKYLRTLAERALSSNFFL